LRQGGWLHGALCGGRTSPPSFIETVVRTAFVRRQRREILLKIKKNRENKIEKEKSPRGCLAQPCDEAGDIEAEPSSISST
jgi:hypothetical protein